MPTLSLETALPTDFLLRNGDFRLERCVARGGFGITYRALDTSSHKLVAIKECFPSGCAREENRVVAGDFFSHSHLQTLKNRLSEQARVLGELNHPNIVKIHDCFEENETIYLVMDWLDGPTLLEMVEENGPFPAKLALGRAGELAAALEAMHRAGLLHLDIKPENAIFCDGRAVLVDFDLLQRRDGADLTTRPLALLRQCGTPGYAPLEQYGHSAPLSTATDVYALAATLHHLLTGQAPLSSVDRAAGVAMESAAQICEIPEPLARALERALALKSDERTLSVTAFRAAWTAPQKSVSMPAPTYNDDAPQFDAHQVALSQAKLAAGVYRIVLTIEEPVFPTRCACCGEKTHAKSAQLAVKTPSHRWNVPLCETCSRHEKAARAAGMVTFWGLGWSAILAIIGGWVSVSTDSPIPLSLCFVALLVCFGSMSYGALKSSRAEEMMKTNCCNVAEPVTCNFNGRVHIWRFKNALYAEEFKKKNAGFVV